MSDQNNRSGYSVRRGKHNPFTQSKTQSEPKGRVKNGLALLIYEVFFEGMKSA